MAAAAVEVAAAPAEATPARPAEAASGAAKFRFTPPAGPLRGPEIPERDGMFVVHNGFRADFVRMVKAARALRVDSEQWKFVNFFRYYNEVFCVVLHDHHEIEETIFVPAINRHGNVVPAKIAEDHGDLMARTADVGDRLRILAVSTPATRTPEQIEELARRVEALQAHMLEHFEEEEAILPALARRYMSIEEYREMEGRIIEKTKPVGDILLPWFAYHRKEGDFEIVLPAVPACLLANCWSPNFVNNLLPLIESIYDPKIAPPKAKSSCCC